MPDQPHATPAPDAAAPHDFADDDPRIAHNRVWFNLLRIQRSTMARVGRTLRAAGIDDPVWYEILLEIERAGAAGIQMAELERRLFMAQYALSRQTARLLAAGLVRREKVPGTGRGQRLFLTERGCGLHQRIWPAYMQAIQDEFADRLSVEEAYALCRGLIRLYP